MMHRSEDGRKTALITVQALTLRHESLEEEDNAHDVSLKPFRLIPGFRLISTWLPVGGSLRGRVKLGKGFWFMEVKDDYCYWAADRRCEML